MPRNDGNVRPQPKRRGNQSPKHGHQRGQLGRYKQEAVHPKKSSTNKGDAV